jgi:hypothetical protein
VHQLRHHHAKHHAEGLLDDKSRFMWLALLATKSDTLVVLKKFQMMVMVETGRRL